MWVLREKVYPCVKGRCIIWVHTLTRGMCRAGGRCTAEQPKPRVLRLYPEKLEVSQMQWIPKPLKPQPGFSTFKPQLFQCHCIMKLQQCEWHILSSQKNPPFSTVYVSYRISNWYGLSYVCPSMNKGLRTLSLAYYCSDTNGGIKYLLNRGHLNT